MEAELELEAATAPGGNPNPLRRLPQRIREWLARAAEDLRHGRCSSESCGRAGGSKGGVS
jgi:hypothetical protein